MGQDNSVERLEHRFKAKNIVVFLLVFSVLYSLFSISTPVFADCTTVEGEPCPAPGIVQVQQLLTRVINISTTIAFMALTVWLVWGALKFFITSGGDPKALAHAWQSVTWAFMGIFFLVLAFLVLKLIAAFTGAEVTLFCLGFPPYCADRLIP